ncbi:MAG: S41 family peptidase [Candidatus Saccharibacteria bacterium]|nr:S41 family peptidase [Candidatus Saccharibacteria bacterium]
MKQGEKRTGWLVAWAAVIATVSFIAGTRADQLLATIAPVFGWRTATGTIDLSSVQETYRQLKANYDGTLDEAALIHGANRGLVAAAGDVHTVYMDPGELAEFDKSLAGIVEGIGAEIGQRGGRPTILRPLKDSPAEKAGIKAGDVIVKINDEAALEWTVDKVVEKIRGEVNTSVRLTLLRGQESKEIAVTRQKVASPTVEHTIEGKTGILTVHRFNNETTSLARAAAEGFRRQGVDKVILDLRGNPGGMVSAAQGLAGLWLDKKVIMTERRGGAVVKTVHSSGAPVLAGVKTAVLLNEGSASASEIIAGALRDHLGVTLIGEKSYGKGSVQRVVSLCDGAQIKVTEARWFTPKGVNIDGEGIAPDRVVKMTREDYEAERDPQLDAAKSL